MPDADIKDLEFLIGDIANIWRKLLNSLTKKLNISNAERRILFAIDRHPGSTQISIADLVEQGPQSLTRILDKLEAYGWIEKKPDTLDRRANRLRCTGEAQKIIKKIRQIGDDFIKKDALSNISTTQQQTLNNGLQQIKSNLVKLLHTEK